MAGGLTCFTLDGSGPVPFPGSFFLPLAVPDTMFAALFFQVTFFHLCFTFFHLGFTFCLPFLPFFFNLFFTFFQGTANFPGAGGRGGWR